MDMALAAFDEVAANPGVGAFGLYHKALALASVGDYEGAAEMFSGAAGPHPQQVTVGQPDMIRFTLKRRGDNLVVLSVDGIENDHIAFRTMGVPHLGIASFEKIFLHYGYAKRDFLRSARFHDVLLGEGSLPPVLMRRAVLGALERRRPVRATGSGGRR